MPITATAITVATSSSTLIARGNAGSVDDPIPVLIHCMSTTTARSVYIQSQTIGESCAVGSSSGFEIEQGVSISAQLFGNDAIYLWTSSTGGVRVDRMLGRQ